MNSSRREKNDDHELILFEPIATNLQNLMSSAHEGMWNMEMERERKKKVVSFSGGGKWRHTN